MEVFQARVEHLEDVSKLFNQYRIFYQQPSELEAAKAFLLERFQKQDSTLFVARDHERIVGFIQLYPSFSSVSMKPIGAIAQALQNQSVQKRKTHTGT